MRRILLAALALLLLTMPAHALEPLFGDGLFELKERQEK